MRDSRKLAKTYLTQPMWECDMLGPLKKRKKKKLPTVKSGGGQLGVIIKYFQLSDTDHFSFYGTASRPMAKH